MPWPTGGRHRPRTVRRRWSRLSRRAQPREARPGTSGAARRGPRLADDSVSYWRRTEQRLHADWSGTGCAAIQVLSTASAAVAMYGTSPHSYGPFMGIIEAAAWGLAGGLAAGLISLSADVVLAGFKWPWRDNDDGIGPRLFVTSVLLIVGALVAAAAHSQMTGGWPAFIMGASAPSVIRGALSRVEVTERKPDEPGSVGI
jgi:hypothetical protein